MKHISKNLIEITTNRQKKNGTVAVKCLTTGAIYTSHSNGYVRRETINANGKRIQYQLNPVCKFSGNRIMLSSLMRIEKIFDSVAAYIVTKQKRNNK